MPEPLRRERAVVGRPISDRLSVLRLGAFARAFRIFILAWTELVEAFISKTRPRVFIIF